MDDLLINGNRISEVNETKFLGVIIDNKLNWSPHIMHISKKMAKGIGIILKARKVFDNVTLFSLYYTFIKHTSITVSMYGVKHMIRIFII